MGGCSSTRRRRCLCCSLCKTRFPLWLGRSRSFLLLFLVYFLSILLGDRVLPCTRRRNLGPASAHEQPDVFLARRQPGRCPGLSGGPIPGFTAAFSVIWLLLLWAALCAVFLGICKRKDLITFGKGGFAVNAVTMRDYTKILKGRTVLDHVNLELETGKCYGFLRARTAAGNPCCFAPSRGLIHPTAGSVSVFGQVLGKDCSFPQSMGLIIENVGFWPYYTGFENLKMLASIRNEITRKRHPRNPSRASD